MRKFIALWDGMENEFIAETRSKARYAAFKALRSAGFDPKLIDIRVRVA